MPKYAVFLAESDHCEMLPVQAMDADHAVDIVRAGHPNAFRLAVIAIEHLEGVNQTQLLADWCAAKGCELQCRATC
jgi:hypothetical protein